MITILVFALFGFLFPFFIDRKFFRYCITQHDWKGLLVWLLANFCMVILAAIIGMAASILISGAIYIAFSIKCGLWLCGFN